MKKVKQLIYTLSIVLALSFIIPPIQTNATDWTTYTVHITRTGSKYHRGGCSYLRKSDYTINILDAIKQGYTPCSRCNPPAPDVSVIYSDNTTKSTTVSTTNTYTTTNTYIGYYVTYTTEYNRRMNNNEFDTGIFNTIQSINTFDSYTSEEQVLYASLSTGDQYDFTIYKFLSLYDYYIALLNSMSPVFDADYYYLYNTDVSSVIGYDKIALLNHFLTQGMAEGRQGDAAFNVQYYMNNNPDLIPLYGNDLSQYYMHYINYGQYEGRKVF